MAATAAASEPSPASAAELEAWDGQRDPRDVWTRLVARAGETFLGYCIVASRHWDAKHRFFVRVFVHPDSPGQGTGSALLTAGEAFARAHGAQRLESTVRDVHPAALQWAIRRGYKQKHHIFESTLDTAAWDPQAWAFAPERLAAQGLRLVRAVDVAAGPELDARIYALHNRLWRDMPGIEPDEQDTPREQFVRDALDNHGHDRKWVWVAADGDRWAGMTAWMRREAGSAYTWFTGVDREYRGRGIALALKVAAVAAGKAAGIPVMRTNNHSANQPMLKVNRKLGYQPEPGFYTLEKPVG